VAVEKRAPDGQFGWPMTEIAATSEVTSPPRRADFKRLMLFFALVYVVEGIGQSDGLISQPLNYYLKQVYQWTPVQITAFLTVLNLPWFLKPLYGIVSDFVPLFGSRRKAYLLLANALAAIAYFSMAQAAAPNTLLLLLLLAVYGMAIASTVAGAVLVENGQRLHASSTFINQQWLWFEIAAIGVSFTGGALVQWLSPIGALHTAALIAALPPLLIIVATLFLIDEDKSTISLAGLKQSLRGLKTALAMRRLWVLALFLFFYYFSPGIDTPLYFYMTDHLQFSQAFIGALNSIGAFGWIVAAAIYGLFLRDLDAKALLNVTILVGVLATLAFLSMHDPITAAFAQFVYGGASMMTAVATLGLAADLCPKHSEGFVYAAMLAVTNIAAAAADNVGSYLYEHVFNSALSPLILVAAAFTAVNFALVPFLHLGKENPDTAPLLRK
jgi:MFS family permease